MKKFETYPQVKYLTEKGSLTRIRVVIQDTRKVIKCFSGIESMAYMYLWKNMKQNQFALIFNDETEVMLGYISKNEYGIPQRYQELEHLTFSDMYERG